MKERKWTPGEWVERVNPRFEYLEVLSGQVRISDINDDSDVTFGPVRPEAIANAYLIAAAPDLYEALEAARDILEALNIDTSDEDAALAKARGES